MNVPITWLKDYVNIDCTIKDFENKMTMSGSKVEKIIETAKDIENVVVGKILKIEKHKDADKLVVCKLDIGSELLQIVTGAKNVFVGAVVPVAKVGAVLAGNFKIKESKLRGELSQGMLCSVEELGFKVEDFAGADFPIKDQEGIYIFNEEVEIGMCVKEALLLEETIVEFEITSNRPDCLSILGIAREVGAVYNTPHIKKVITIKEEGNKKTEDNIEVSVTTKLCNRYSTKIIDNIKICDSPLWLKRRLSSAGVRPINNIVDITNYVMIEYGQPLHAFDFDKIKGNKITIEESKNVEKLLCLDGEKRKIPEGTLVIRDEEKTIAVAGIIGLENSKVDKETKKILLESGNFDGINTRLTSKKLNLRTDSSGKFEKGLDPQQTLEALNRATQLIEELCKGKSFTGAVDIYTNKKETTKIKLDDKKINSVLGTNISFKEMVKILEKLEMEVENGEVIVPSFRADISRVEDLSEEIGRIYGYDNIPTLMPTSNASVGKLTYEQNIHKIIKNTMVAMGSFECKNYSFEGEGVFDKLNILKDSHLREVVEIKNPLGKEFAIMRTTTLNGMLNSLSTNFNKQVKDCNLFEVGKIYLPKSLPLNELPVERNILTIGLYGGYDFYSVKGMMENILDILNIEDFTFVADKNITYLHSGRSVVCYVNKERLCEIGEVHPEVIQRYEIKKRVYIAEINIDLLVKYANLEVKYKELPKYQNSTRDISITLRNSVEVGEIEKIIYSKGGKNLEAIELFDVYKGNQVEEGYKSVAYNLSFRAGDRTLTEKEVSNSMKKIVEALENKLEAKLRK